MFRQLKSALIWTTIYRFRKKIIFVLLLLLLALVIEFFYQDFVQYLLTTKNTSYLGLLFFMKWMLYLFIFASIIYNLSALTKKKSKSENKKKLDISKMSKSEISELAQKIIDQKRH